MYVPAAMQAPSRSFETAAYTFVWNGTYDELLVMSVIGSAHCTLDHCAFAVQPAVGNCSPQHR